MTSSDLFPSSPLRSIPIPAKRPNKFKAQRTEVDGHKFASKLEAKRYAHLKMLERAGIVSNLELQPRFPLVVGGVTVATYVADFAYFDTEKNARIFEDVKSKPTRTALYRLKIKLVHALFPGVVIQEVG